MRKFLTAMLALSVAGVLAFGVIGSGAAFIATGSASQTLTLGSMTLVVSSSNGTVNPNGSVVPSGRHQPLVFAVSRRRSRTLGATSDHSRSSGGICLTRSSLVQRDASGNCDSVQLPHWYVATLVGRPLSTGLDSTACRLAGHRTRQPRCRMDFNRICTSWTDLANAWIRHTVVVRHLHGIPGLRGSGSATKAPAKWVSEFRFQRRAGLLPVRPCRSEYGATHRLVFALGILHLLAHHGVCATVRGVSPMDRTAGPSWAVGQFPVVVIALDRQRHTDPSRATSCVLRSTWRSVIGSSTELRILRDVGRCDQSSSSITVTAQIDSHSARVELAQIQPREDRRCHLEVRRVSPSRWGSAHSLLAHPIVFAYTRLGRIWPTPRSVARSRITFDIRATGEQLPDRVQLPCIRQIPRHRTRSQFHDRTRVGKHLGRAAEAVSRLQGADLAARPRSRDGRSVIADRRGGSRVISRPGRIEHTREAAPSLRRLLASALNVALLPCSHSRSSSATGVVGQPVVPRRRESSAGPWSRRSLAGISSSSRRHLRRSKRG